MDESRVQKLRSVLRSVDMGGIIAGRRDARFFGEGGDEEVQSLNVSSKQKAVGRENVERFSKISNKEDQMVAYQELKGHRDLKVYQLAYKPAMEIFNASKRFPKEEKYSLTDQIRRSSRSIAANIAV